MMDIGFDKARWTMDASGLWLCLRVDDPQAARRLCDGMEANPEKKYRVEIKEARKKRSLDANAYCWVLIGKIADAIRRPKDDVYIEMLKSYGQGGVVKIPDDMADRVLRAIKYWEPHEKLPPEERAKYYRVWVGSSQYDTLEMSIFIDGIIQECQQLDIPTATPDEIENMKSLWGEHEKQTNKGAGDSPTG